MNLDQYLIPVTEGYLLSKKDSVYNLEKWKPGQNNILYVTGLSGGGKSTIAKEYSEKYHAYHIELDICEIAYQFLKHPNPFYEYQNEKDVLMILEFYNQHPFKDPEKMNDEEYTSYQLELFNYMLKRMKEDRLHLYVVEGIQLLKLAHLRYHDEILRAPLIIKNTSMLDAMIRRWKRDGKDALRVGGDQNLKNQLPIGRLFKFINWYFDQEYSLNCFRRDRNRT